MRRYLPALIVVVILAMLVIIGLQFAEPTGEPLDLPPDLEMQFSSPSIHGFLRADGLYLAVSRGAEIGSVAELEIAENQRAYLLEFPLTTADGQMVYGSFYLLGQVDRDTVTAAFSGEKRSVFGLTDEIPSIARRIMEEEVGRIAGVLLDDDKSSVRIMLKQTISARVTNRSQAYGLQLTQIAVMLKKP